MNSNDIYSILSSKSHNPHYLKRYFKFIQWCQENPTVDEYVEKHHICPKSVDLFPEYASFSDHRWNQVSLTAREHIMAHIMLWKAYGGRMSMALECMLGNFNSETNALLSNRKIPTAIEIRYLARVRKEAAKLRGEHHRGKATFKNSSGERFFLSVDDPIIQELGLVGYRRGMTNLPETNEKQKRTRFRNRKIKLHNLTDTVNVKIFSDDYLKYVDLGYHPELTPEDLKVRRKEADEKNSIFWTNRARYMTQDGVYHGSYLKDDKIIQELDLVPLRTEAQIAQVAERTKLAAKAKTGSRICNNGTEEKFLHELPEGWKYGRLPRSAEWEANRKASYMTKVAGSKTYNNGTRNMFIRPGESIPDGFVPGMKPRKPK